MGLDWPGCDMESQRPVWAPQSRVSPETQGRQKLHLVTGAKWEQLTEEGSGFGEAGLEGARQLRPRGPRGPSPQRVGVQWGGLSTGSGLSSSPPAHLSPGTNPQAGWQGECTQPSPLLLEIRAARPYSCSGCAVCWEARAGSQSGWHWKGTGLPGREGDGGVSGRGPARSRQDGCSSTEGRLQGRGAVRGAVSGRCLCRNCRHCWSSAFSVPVRGYV